MIGRDFKARAESLKQKKAQQADRLEARCQKEKAKCAKVKRAAWQSKLNALPKVFSAKDCGQGHPKGGGPKEHQKRVQCLERLKLRAPALPIEKEALWKSVAEKYSQKFARDSHNNTGNVFIAKVNEVIKALGHHLKGSASSHGVAATAAAAADAVAGNAGAFERFFDHMDSQTPKPCISVKL